MRRLIACSVFLAVSLVSACSQYPPAPEGDVGDANSSLATGPGQETDAASDSREGVDAVWRLPEGVHLEATATSFPAEVSRVGCNSGVTGEVLAPTVEEGTRGVVVTFTVSPEPVGNQDCPGNEWVPYTVKLSEPLGQRVLIDGECVPMATATVPGFCNREGVRYRVSHDIEGVLSVRFRYADDTALYAEGARHYVRLLNRAGEVVLVKDTGTEQGPGAGYRTRLSVAAGRYRLETFQRGCDFVQSPDCENAVGPRQGICEMKVTVRPHRTTRVWVVLSLPSECGPLASPLA